MSAVELGRHYIGDTRYWAKQGITIAIIVLLVGLCAFSGCWVMLTSRSWARQSSVSAASILRSADSSANVDWCDMRMEGGG